MAKKNEVTQTQGLTAELAKRFNMDATVFLSTIKSTVMPSSAKQEEVAAFLMVSKEYDLNPLLREIHAFPKKGGGIQTVVGVDGWAKIISRHKDYNGAEFIHTDDAQGKPMSCTCKLHRKDTEYPTEVTEYYSECFRATDPWKQMPRRMLRHKAFMQAGRYAFGISGIMDQDEANDIKEVDIEVVDPLTPGRHTSKTFTHVEPAPEYNSDPEPETVTTQVETEVKPAFRSEAYPALADLYKEFQVEIDENLKANGLSTFDSIDAETIDTDIETKLTMTLIDIKRKQAES